MYTKENIKWKKENFEVLGVTVCNTTSDAISLNYDKILNKTEAILQNWKGRQLNLVGKVQIINSMVASLYVYKMSVLPLLPSSYCKKLENICTKFLWDGRRPKISLKKLQLSKKEGGLGLVDFRLKDIALKIFWVKELFTDLDQAKLAYAILAPKLKNDIWECNLNEKDIKILFKTSFWRDTLIAWSHVNFGDAKSSDEVLNQWIWLNSYMHVNDKPYFLRKPSGKA